MTYNSLEANMRRAEQNRISDQRRFEWRKLEFATEQEIAKFNSENTAMLDKFASEHGWTRQHMHRFAKRLYSEQFCAYYKRYSKAFESPDMEYV